jgi:hypothetical protein
MADQEEATPSLQGLSLEEDSGGQKPTVIIVIGERCRASNGVF